MDSSVSGKDEIWFLRVCHHVPHELYQGYASGVKRPGRGFDHPLHVAPRLRMSRAMPVLPFCAFMGCCGVTFILTNRTGRIFTLLITLYRAAVPKTENSKGAMLENYFINLGKNIYCVI